MGRITLATIATTVSSILKVIGVKSKNSNPPAKKSKVP
ncbi:hypothetical protein C900_00970 [Fulvivirga imtechensis AK7]|uniref:Uncharacterized protein n=1 Tax=Fulvivirga imtechensis AK7 TaxID=1237149 RepID=L8JUA4_9BACT|nr:hypothetical protein C900_00970 [Fulvivirga imtechensis AK7]